MAKNLLANAGDLRDPGLISGSGRFPGVENGTPLQNFCLENSMGGETGGLLSTGLQNWTQLSAHTSVVTCCLCILFCIWVCVHVSYSSEKTSTLIYFQNRTKIFRNFYSSLHTWYGYAYKW